MILFSFRRLTRPFLMKNTGVPNGVGIAGFQVFLPIVHLLGILIKANHKISINSVNRDPDGRFLILDVVIDGFHVILVTSLCGLIMMNLNFILMFFLNWTKVIPKVCQLQVMSDVALGPLDYRGSCSEHRNINSRKALVSLMDEFNLTDLWRNEHRTLRAYTRHQSNPPVLSTLNYILSVLQILLTPLSAQKIICGIKSDHSIDTSKDTDKRLTFRKGLLEIDIAIILGMMLILSLLYSVTFLNLRQIHGVTDCDSHMSFGSPASNALSRGHCIQHCTLMKKDHVKKKSSDIQSQIAHS